MANEGTVVDEEAEIEDEEAEMAEEVGADRVEV